MGSNVKNDKENNRGRLGSEYFPFQPLLSPQLFFFQLILPQAETKFIIFRLFCTRTGILNCWHEFKDIFGIYLIFSQATFIHI